MSTRQKEELNKILLKDILVEKCISEFHHGDCKGADEEAHAMVSSIRHNRNLYPQIVIHPPTNNKYRAFLKGEVDMPWADYIDRNHQIVDSVDMLVACPKSEEEELRSGTWATIRYAKRKCILIVIVYPSGRLERLP
jgi:hypothetical protein